MMQANPERWLLGCPVDEAVIAPGTGACPDCGLSTAPLRALASVAAAHLETAALVDGELALGQVEAAAAMVPESENFLLDAGRALAAAGAYEAALDALKRAVSIAPGRKDINAELAAVRERIDQAAWLMEKAVRAPSPPAPPVDEPSRMEVATAHTPRARLMNEHVHARARRDGATLGSGQYREACLEVARIEIAIAGLALRHVTTA